MVRKIFTKKITPAPAVKIPQPPKSIWGITLPTANDFGTKMFEKISSFKSPAVNLENTAGKSGFLNDMYSKITSPLSRNDKKDENKPSFVDQIKGLKIFNPLGMKIFNPLDVDIVNPLKITVPKLPDPYETGRDIKDAIFDYGKSGKEIFDGVFDVPAIINEKVEDVKESISKIGDTFTYAIIIIGIAVVGVIFWKRR